MIRRKRAARGETYEDAKEKEKGKKLSEEVKSWKDENLISY